VTNCLFGALRAMAAAQDTMHNLTFGNERMQYYAQPKKYCWVPRGKSYDSLLLGALH
jgi:hypothetical protein